MGTTAAVVVAFQWLDRPIAIFVHEHLRRPHHGLLDQFTHYSNPLISLAIVIFVVLGLQALIGRPLSRHQADAFFCSFGVVFSDATKDQLKFLFGRTWPEPWLGDNPSFIGDGTYGFNFMHGGNAYQSFPSGHMAAACAVLSVLWIRYPRLRVLCAIAGLAVAGGLVGANYHFLSDVIAGAFLGVSTGWMAIAVWVMLVPVVVGSQK